MSKIFSLDSSDFPIYTVISPSIFVTTVTNPEFIEE